jgi:Na+/phosphate symporter
MNSKKALNPIEIFERQLKSGHFTKLKEQEMELQKELNEIEMIEYYKEME